LANEFDISRYVQVERRNTPARDGSKDLPGVREIRRMPFAQWLAATDRLETFLMTHRESYGYSVLDMFARGTRVLCPRPFVPLHFRDRFHFGTFETSDELLDQLRTPPDPRKLAENRAGLGSWKDLVSLIDDRFQKLLHHRYGYG
jgi:hypothetical protein